MPSSVRGFLETVCKLVFASPQETIQQLPVRFVREDCLAPSPPNPNPQEGRKMYEF